MALTYTDPIRTMDIRGVITQRNGTQIQITNADIASYEITESVGAEGIALGTAEAASFRLTLADTNNTYSIAALDGAEVHMFVGLVTGGTTAWTDFGVWYICQVESSEQSTSISIQGYDALATLFEVNWTDASGSYPSTIGSIATAVCAAAGIPLKSNSFLNAAVRVAKMPEWADDITLRGVIGYCAACAGGFARISRDGYLEIVSYTEGQTYALDPSLYVNLTPRGGENFAFNCIEAKIGDEEDFTRYMVDTTLEDNPTNTIQIEGNPLLTATIVQSLVTEFTGLVISPVDLVWIGDPAVLCGDMLTVTDLSSGTWTMLVNSQTIAFDGGLNETSSCQLPALNSIDSSSYTTTGNIMDANGNIRATRISGLDSSVVSATTGHFENLTASTINTDQLVASLIAALTLKAVNISATSVETDSLTALVADILDATIAKIQAGTIVTDALYSAFSELSEAYIGTANIDYARIKYATIGTGVINEFITRDGTADKFFIDKLQVRNLQVIEQTVGSLIIKASDGNYYQLDVDIDSGTVTPTQVTPTSTEINDGVTTDGTRSIIETDLTVADLGATTIKAINAMIDSITGQRIVADEAFIQRLFVNTIINNSGDTITLMAQKATETGNKVDSILTVSSDGVTVSIPNQPNSTKAVVTPEGFKVIDNATQVTASLGSKRQTLGTLIIRETSDGGHAFYNTNQA